MNDFLFIMEKLGMTAYKIELDRDRVYHLGSKNREWEEVQDLTWTEFLEKNKKRFLIEKSTEIFSIESLKGAFERGEDNRNFELPEKNIRLLFSGEKPERYAYLLEIGLSEEEIVKRVIRDYMSEYCDYFIFLDAENNSYMTFTAKDNGTPLPPKKGSDYEKEVTIYAKKHVVEEDIEHVIREMALSRVLEQLDRFGIHTFYAGVLEPALGYRRKKVEYRYYNKEDKKVIVSRLDVTDSWLEEQRRHKEYMAAQYRASTDSLTGLLNLGGFREKIQEMLVRGAKRWAILFLDLDNLKEINDTYGHGMGDQALKEVARILKEKTGPQDLAGRIGGDEFVICLGAVDKRSDAEAAAEAICARMETIRELDGKKIRISISIGVAVSPEDGTDYESLVREADSRLYQVKRKKREN